MSELADVSGIEARTIRNYIERGLLPGAQTRGRAATYSTEHLSRLQIISALKRARPTIGLGEIRIFLQGLNPEQIRSLAGGSLSAAVRVVGGQDQSREGESADLTDADQADISDGDEADEIAARTELKQNASNLTGAERLVSSLRKLSGLTAPPAATSKVEGWSRIAVTPDIELCVRAEFDADQLAAFRELADLLRGMLQRPNIGSIKEDE